MGASRALAHEAKSSSSMAFESKSTFFQLSHEVFPCIPFSKYDKGDVTCKMKHEPTKTTSQNPCFCSISFTRLRNDFVEEYSKKTAAKIRYRRDRSHWGCHHTWCFSSDAILLGNVTHKSFLDTPCIFIWKFSLHHLKLDGQGASLSGFTWHCYHWSGSGFGCSPLLQFQNASVSLLAMLLAKLSDSCSPVANNNRRAFSVRVYPNMMILYISFACVQTLKSPLPPHFPKFSWPKRHDKGPVWRYLSLRSFETQENSPPPKTCRLESKSETNNSSTYAAHNSSNSDNNDSDSDNMNNNHHHSMLQAAVPAFLPNAAPPQFQRVTNGLSIQVIVHSCIFSSATTTLTGTPWKVTFQQSKSLVTGNQPASRLTTYPSVGLGGLLDPMTTIDTEQLLHVSDGKLSCRKTHPKEQWLHREHRSHLG